MSSIGDKFKLKLDPDGKVKVERDEAKIKAAKPVNARFPSKKPRVAKRGEVFNA